MKISAIIVHWNTPNELKKQISLLKPTKELEVIIIDNASEKSIKNLKLETKNFRLIKNKSNLGYAKACNQGAKIAKGEWLLFLNPDTHISSQNVVRFVSEAEKLNYDAASLKPTSDNYSKPLPSALSLLVEFSPLRRLISLNFFRKKTLFGGGLLIKKSVFNGVGGWDRHFFLWFEDSDITKRLLKKSYKIGWISIAHNHVGGASFTALSEKRKRQIFFTSMSQYANKHFSALGIKIFKFVNLLNNR